MEWTDFVSFISLPLIALVGFQMKQVQRVKEDLASYKTQVAENYTSVIHLKEVKDDIMKYLEKIERKLDKYANGK